MSTLCPPVKASQDINCSLSTQESQTERPVYTTQWERRKQAARNKATLFPNNDHVNTNTDTCIVITTPGVGAHCLGGGTCE